MITPVKAALVELEGIFAYPSESIGFSDALVLNGMADDVFLKIEGKLNLHNALILHQFLGDIIEAMKQTGPEERP